MVGPLYAHPKNTTTVHPRAFCKILAVGLINRNLDLLSGYPLDKQHYVEGVPPRPYELWKWGMAKETGLLRPIETKILSQKLLDRDVAQATRQGLLFRGVTFTNARLAKLDWFSLAGLKARSKVNIAYDERSITKTYLVPDEFGSELEPLELTPRWKQHHFDELSWREVKALFDQAKKNKVTASRADLHRKIDTRGYQDAILAESKKHFESTTPYDPADGRNPKDHIRKLEVECGGIANVPLDRRDLPALSTHGASAQVTDVDDEQAELAELLLSSAENTGTRN